MSAQPTIFLSRCRPWSPTKVQLSQENCFLPFHFSVLGFLFLAQTPLLLLFCVFPFSFWKVITPTLCFCFSLNCLHSWNPGSLLNFTSPFSTFKLSFYQNLQAKLFHWQLSTLFVLWAEGHCWRKSPNSTGALQIHSHTPWANGTSLELLLPWSILFLQPPQCLLEAFSSISSIFLLCPFIFLPHSDPQMTWAATSRRYRTH